jgi:hypothetical protein
MLEMDVVEGDDLKVQIIIALQSTAVGRRNYAQLCDRQTALKELVCIAIVLLYYLINNL